MSVIQTFKRSARDAVVELGLADAAFWMYGQVSRLSPASMIVNANHRRRGAPDHLPIPPSDLIFLVAGTASISWFLRGGTLAMTSIVDILGRHGVDITGLDAMLDFGCGCGRVLRNWHALPHTEIHGTDYNPRLVGWCRQNLPFATFGVNQLSPPLAYGDGQFDLVYALSVFTHLTEELQTAWLTELVRVVKPGGHLVISLHGEAYVHRLDEKERRRFKAGRLVVKNNVKSPGSNTCSAYHPFAYVRDQLAHSLELVEFRAEGAAGNPHQDLYLLRKSPA
jgi:SAM-dependent methyltransferase